ncbi:GNAT family N-acetyltransferase [Proteiniclasticum sp. C24MP]|uniref:GNAT family N-acetyltransferase n=1 Tax=Proteiniclasticum sp. C24MP TaxID=3374101 RepID=UPI003754FA61
MRIELFRRGYKVHEVQAAELLREAFPVAYGEDPEEEVHNILQENRIAAKAVFNGEVVGLVGAIPQYGDTGWELHPLVVRKDYRGKGVGAKLTAFLEEAVAEKGAVTLYLGTDDETGATSLSNTDLFQDPFRKIAEIRNLKGHPYEFYKKMGYSIVGVIPDTNGIGKPDIWMAKSLVR